MAKAMFRGLRKYKDEVEGNKKEYNDEFENQAPIENENVKAGNMPGQKKTADDEDDENNEVTKVQDEELKQEVTELTKKESLGSLQSTSTTAAPEKKEEKKEAVDDDKYADIDLKKVDSTKAMPVKEDTALTAKDIAKNFKKESTAVKTKTVAANETHLPDVKKKEESNKESVFFKVQFATSDIALNLKQEKFAALSDVDFYKVNNVLKYTSGKFVNVKDAVAHQSNLREKGFKDCFIIAMKNGERMDLAEAKRITGQ